MRTRTASSRGPGYPADFRRWALVERNAGEARRWAGDVLGRWGLGEDEIYVGRLIVSELASNACRHASGAEFAVRLERIADRALIEVWDGTAEFPGFPAAHDDLDALTGRGLLIVRECSVECGVAGLGHDGYEKSVWAAVDLL
jgi:anti-sigma regulatory factor (Ser/Thr protein kinase)